MGTLRGSQGYLDHKTLPPPQSYSRPMPRPLWWSKGGGAVSYERGTPEPIVQAGSVPGSSSVSHGLVSSIRRNRKLISMESSANPSTSGVKRPASPSEAELGTQAHSVGLLGAGHTRDLLPSEAGTTNTA